MTAAATGDDAWGLFPGVGPEMGAEIRSVAFCAADPTCGTFALGTVDGRVRLTVDGGASFVAVDSPLPGPRAIGDLEFTDGCQAQWIAVSGFSTPGLLLAGALTSGAAPQTGLEEVRGQSLK